MLYHYPSALYLRTVSQVAYVVHEINPRYHGVIRMENALTETVQLLKHSSPKLWIAAPVCRAYLL